MPLTAQRLGYFLTSTWLIYLLPIFPNDYFLKSVFHLCCPRPSQRLLLGMLFSGSYMAAPCSLSCTLSGVVSPLLYLLPAWQISLSSTFLSSLPGHPKSPASVSLPSHLLAATLFTNQIQLGIGFPQCLMCRCADSCAILGTQINISQASLVQIHDSTLTDCVIS